MSMPEFPEVNPDLTRDQALNMILASIAMEEAALSHIINAEGEKLQYVLGTLDTRLCRRPTVEEVLAVNQSVTCLLDSVSQNQMILKSKMDKAIGALPKPHPEPCPVPPCPPKPQCPEESIGHGGKRFCKCSAVFKAAEKCQLWYEDSALCWNKTNISGRCICFDHCDKTKIHLRSKGRFAVSFAVNVNAKSSCKCDAEITLQMINGHQRTDIYTVRNCVTDDTISTVSMGGIIVETDSHAHSSLMLRLVSSDTHTLITEDAMLSIMEI